MVSERQLLKSWKVWISSYERSIWNRQKSVCIGHGGGRRDIFEVGWKGRQDLSQVVLMVWDGGISLQLHVGHSNQWYVVWLNNPLIFIGIESFATVQCWSISRSYFNLGRSHNVLFYSWGRAEPIWSLFKGNWLYGGGQEGGYHIFQLVNESSGLS